MIVRRAGSTALLSALLMSGCATAPAAPASAPATTAAEDSDATIIERSHALLDAFYDREDPAQVRELLAPGFVKFENHKVTDREALLRSMAGWTPHPPMMTRTWNEQHVYRRGGDAVFLGMAVEHETGNDVHGNRAYHGWYTISWVRDGGAWKASHLSWQPHRTKIERERDTWNDNYRQGKGFDPRPNRLLVDAVRGVKPGAALDVMMGQGRNAIHLASQGWKVTGVDIADEGLRIARDTAAAQQLELHTVHADVDTYDFGASKWDLVTMIYAGSDVALIEKIKPSLRRGGLFVTEYFAADAPGGDGFAQGQLAKLFGDGFDVLRDDFIEDQPDWARNRAKLVRFVARKR